jgi:Mg/Co/Ni transporter MgtE
LARRDVPTCALADDVETVTARVAETDWTICAVVNPERVLLGLLGRSGLGRPGRAAELMREGPSTIRPDEARDAVAARMGRHDLSVQLVTTSDGRLVGVVRREDVG